MVTLIRTHGREFPLVRHISSADRAWEIIRKEIQIAADEMKISEYEREHGIKFYPCAASIERRGSEFCGVWYEEMCWSIVDNGFINYIE